MVRYVVAKRPALFFERSSRLTKRPLPTLTSTAERHAEKPVIKFEEFVSRSMITRQWQGADKLCLLIPGHNESLVIQNTIRSAFASGMDRRDIFVVNDNSSDDTAELAIELLGQFNVLTVGRSGKGGAIQKAARAFRLSERYEWIHIADADGTFDIGYFDKFRAQLRSDKAAATGYMKSTKGSYIGKFRVFEYTLGMELTRRVQVMLNTLQVIPGATSCVRSDVFDQLDFNGGTLTEDYDVTLQIHRQGLGEIQFIPDATAFTQDPENFKDFMKQITRWYRGGVECMIKHAIGKKAKRLDFYIGYQIMQNFLFLGMLFVVMPIITFLTHSWYGYASLFVWDVLAMFIMSAIVAARANRWDILNAFPILYGLKWVNTYAFSKALLEAIFGYRKIVNSGGTWVSPTRVAA
jgi:cellulose synthase/poly-beta-1,6-N-acetylglucosamine synthase-like glycosyltransferase